LQSSKESAVPASSASARTATRKRLITAGVVGVVVVAMFFGTKIVTGDGAAADAGKFSAAEYAAEKWESEVLPGILDNEHDLAEVATAIAADPEAAADEFGVVEGTSAPVYTVSFTGEAGLYEGGIMPVTVEGLPEGVTVRVQMGPAINGTAIRDASGTVHFPQFTNQIEYQDVGSEFNNIVKATVLEGIDPLALNGTTVSITGSFQLINPTSYLVTPVEIESE
jgi:predicted lipoprotein